MKKSLLLILIIIFSCSKKEPVNKNTDEESIYHKKARAFRNSRIADSAFYYYTLAKDEYIKANDSLKTAQSLVNMAIIQTGKGDFYGSVETSLEANQFLKNIKDSTVRRDLASSYNNMGIASAFMYNYDEAIDFYKKAIEYSVSTESRFTYYNNLAVSLLAKKDVPQAKKYLQYAILAKESKNYSRALNNLGKAKFLENNNYNPLPDYYRALEIRKKDNDIEGLNSSYSTLSDYYKEKDKNKALLFAKEMLQTAISVNNPEDHLQALQKLINLDPDHLPQYFKNFQSLNDSLIIARSKAKNQFAYFRFGIEKEKAENLKLKTQSAQKENHILQQYIALGILILVITILVFILMWLKKRQKILKQEKELEVKNTQLKMSKKVHDVVANGLYHMMIDVQNNPEMDKTKILNDIEKMYEESRDISHENIIEKDFSLRFINMISSYSSPEQKVLTVGYKENIWKNVSYNIQLELYYALREILVNMKKHSQAKLASLKFEKNNNILKIKYTDNGIGINSLNLLKGTGITNTENRIDTIGGDITFEKNPAGGLIIQITIPIHLRYV